MDFGFALFLLPFVFLITGFLGLISYLRYFENPFFLQKRLGKNEKPFKVYKLKTYFKGVPTGWGIFLRRYSLDELPQIFNVLRGEMSFVGPRPLPVEYLPVYFEAEKRRHLVKPGITGLAQVKGRNALSWEQKFRYDVFYVKNVSWRLDAYVLCRTFFVLFSREGVDAKGKTIGAVSLLKVRKKGGK